MKRVKVILTSRVVFLLPALYALKTTEVLISICFNHVCVTENANHNTNVSFMLRAEVLTLLWTN